MTGCCQQELWEKESPQQWQPSLWCPFFTHENYKVIKIALMIQKCQQINHTPLEIVTDGSLHYYVIKLKIKLHKKNKSRNLWKCNLSWNLSSLSLSRARAHTHSVTQTCTQICAYPRFIFLQSIPHTCHKCWMIASTAPPVHNGGDWSHTWY